MKSVRLLLACNNFIILVGVLVIFRFFQTESADIIFYDWVSHDEIVKVLEDCDVFDYTIDTLIPRENYTMHFVSGNVNRIVGKLLISSDVSLSVSDTFIGEELLNDWKYNPIGSILQTDLGTFTVKGVIDGGRDVYVLFPKNRDFHSISRQKITVSLYDSELKRVNFLKFKENILSSILPVKHVLYHRDVLNTALRFFSLSIVLQLLLEGYISIKGCLSFKERFNEGRLTRKSISSSLIFFISVIVIVILLRVFIKLYIASFVQYSFDVTSLDSIISSMYHIKGLLFDSFHLGFSRVTIGIFAMSVYFVISHVIVISFFVSHYLQADREK